MKLLSKMPTNVILHLEWKKQQKMSVILALLKEKKTYAKQKLSTMCVPLAWWTSFIFYGEAKNRGCQPSLTKFSGRGKARSGRPVGRQTHAALWHTPSNCVKPRVSSSIQLTSNKFSFFSGLFRYWYQIIEHTVSTGNSFHSWTVHGFRILFIILSYPVLSIFDLSWNFKHKKYHLWNGFKNRNHNKQ